MNSIARQKGQRMDGDSQVKATTTPAPATAPDARRTIWLVRRSNPFIIDQRPSTS
jgi:hypothetical protein